jgi:hypothetical protein
LKVARGGACVSPSARTRIHAGAGQTLKQKQTQNQTQKGGQQAALFVGPSAQRAARG